MMNMTKPRADSPDDRELLPAELRDVFDGVERLGFAERRGAPEGLETRLFAATRGALARGEPGVIARIGGAQSWRFRLAASVLIAGAAVFSAYWMVSRPSGSGGASLAVGAGDSAALLAALDADLSQWVGETGVQSETEIASLHSRLGEIESGDADPWDSLDASAQEHAL